MLDDDVDMYSGNVGPAVAVLRNTLFKGLLFSTNPLLTIAFANII